MYQKVNILLYTINTVVEINNNDLNEMWWLQRPAPLPATAKGLAMQCQRPPAYLKLLPLVCLYDPTAAVSSTSAAVAAAAVSVAASAAPCLQLQRLPCQSFSHQRLILQSCCWSHGIDTWSAALKSCCWAPAQISSHWSLVPHSSCQTPGLSHHFRPPAWPLEPTIWFLNNWGENDFWRHTYGRLLKYLSFVFFSKSYCFTVMTTYTNVCCKPYCPF